MFKMQKQNNGHNAQNAIYECGSRYILLQFNGRPNEELKTFKIGFGFVGDSHFFVFTVDSFILILLNKYNSNFFFIRFLFVAVTNTYKNQV